MEGLYICNARQDELSLDGKDARLSLLARRPDLEVMRQILRPNAVVWISPADDRETMEFFFVLSGSVDLMLDEGAMPIGAGGSFYVDGLTRDVHIRTEKGATLLYITNKPMFDLVYGYQGNLRDLIRQVDEKDHYTFQHCHNVMHYALALTRALAPEGVTLDDIVTAALFHDVGKCFIPDEILKKTGRLTPAEYEQMKEHAADSARLIEPNFGKQIAVVARHHHERLDGSGYPDGLAGESIPLASRIIAVADSFDAMTSERPYNHHPKSFLTAADELAGLPALYDARVCAALRALVESGEMERVRDEATTEKREEQA